MGRWMVHDEGTDDTEDRFASASVSREIMYFIPTKRKRKHLVRALLEAEEKIEEMQRQVNMLESSREEKRLAHLGRLVESIPIADTDRNNTLAQTYRGWRCSINGKTSELHATATEALEAAGVKVII